MSAFRPILAGAVLAAAALVSVDGIAYAATGHDLILGAHNTANKTTALSRSGAGVALALHTHRDEPPLSVNSHKQVANLNASLVGGLAAGALQTRDYQYTLPNAGDVFSSFRYSLTGLPAGSYQVSFDVTGYVGTTNGVFNCGVVAHGGDSQSSIVFNRAIATNNFATVAASKVISLAAGHKLDFLCYPDAGLAGVPVGYTVSSYTPATVDFVKIDSVSRHAVVATH
jgi:hypothetical protein